MRRIKLFSKFAISGAIFGLVNVGIMIFFTEIFGLYYLVSAIISFLVGSSIDY